MFRKRPRTGNFLWIPAAWVICLVIVSLQPVRSDEIRAGTAAHLALHLLAFGFPALLFQIFITRRIWALVSASTVILVAVGIELAQRSLYHHRFEWEDLLADFLGVVIALLLMLPGDGRVSDSA